jgi:hypothetical protein
MPEASRDALRGEDEFKGNKVPPTTLIGHRRSA